jgi:DNA-binding transcriptional LysR family regulator
MHIEYFCYYLDFTKTLSITKTAANHYMTPQGISKAIHSLERELNVSLVNRSGNTISLTCAGHELASEAGEIVAAYERAQRRMTAYAIMSKDFSGPPVKIQVTAFTSTYLLPLMDFQYPQRFSFPITIQESNIFKILPRIASITQPHSFGMITMPQIPEYEAFLKEAIEENQLKYIPLARVPLCALVSISSPYAGFKTLKMSDVKEYPVVCYNDPVLFDAVTKIIGKQCIIMTTNSPTVLAQQLEQNYATTFVPRIIQAQDLPKNTIIKELKGAFWTEVGLIGCESSFNDPLVAEVVLYIRDFFIENRNKRPFKDAYELIGGTGIEAVTAEGELAFVEDEPAPDAPDAPNTSAS